jgi:serine/threonine protein kinase
MIRLLSYFVIKKQTPHIVLPIGTFNTSIKPFVNLINENVVKKDNSKYTEFVEKYEKGEYYDHVSILISEWANRGDFLDFVKKNATEFTLRHWKVFFFQIISVLAVIQSKFPTFRHNDMKANNILVHKIGKRNTLFSYTVNQNVYIVPSIGYQIKLWDFDFACISGLVDNAKVNASWTTDINITTTKHQYYDMHYFFNTFIRKGFFPQIMTEDWVDIEVKKFIKRLLPKKYQKGRHVAKRGRLLVDDEYLTPDHVLQNDPFFEEFRNGVYQKKNKNKKYRTVSDDILPEFSSSE